MINLENNSDYLKFKKELFDLAKFYEIKDFDIIDKQLFYLHFLEGKTPEDAIVELEKALRRIKAIIQDYKNK